MKQIITVKEARKLLGKDYRIKSDEEIIKIIEETHELAKLALETARKRIKKVNTDAQE